MASEHVSMMGQELLERMEGDRFGELHNRLDENTGLRAIIAIHSTRPGPAPGGARCIPYPSFDAAVVGTTTGEHPRGARITVSDIDERAVRRVVESILYGNQEVSRSATE